MAEEAFAKVGHFKDVGAFRAHLASLSVDLPCDEQILSAAAGSPLAQPIDVGGFVVGNRWCIHPMEGWDGTTTGEPTEFTLRRWEHFGDSGAKLIWGGEAFAVQGDGRANPNQVGVVDDDVARAEKGAAALSSDASTRIRNVSAPLDDLLVGLQLTHSGRFCRPH
jgi:2,4-dienoyl-CoA reductase-like NADH-dependent reductase (Old Yellow Enzyme family)